MKKEFERYLIVIDGKNYRLNQIRENLELKQVNYVKRNEINTATNSSQYNGRLKGNYKKSNNPLEILKKRNNLRMLLETYQGKMQNLYNNGASVDEIQRVYEEFESILDELKVGLSQGDINREYEKHKILIDGDLLQIDQLKSYLYCKKVEGENIKNPGRLNSTKSKTENKSLKNDINQIYELDEVKNFYRKYSLEFDRNKMIIIERESGKLIEDSRITAIAKFAFLWINIMGESYSEDYMIEKIAFNQQKQAIFNQLNKLILGSLNKNRMIDPTYICSQFQDEYEKRLIENLFNKAGFLKIINDFYKIQIPEDEEKRSIYSSLNTSKVENNLTDLNLKQSLLKEWNIYNKNNNNNNKYQDLENLLKKTVDFFSKNAQDEQLKKLLNDALMEIYGKEGLLRKFTKKLNIPHSLVTYIMELRCLHEELLYEEKYKNDINIFDRNVLDLTPLKYLIDKKDEENANKVINILIKYCENLSKKIEKNEISEGKIYEVYKIINGTCEVIERYGERNNLNELSRLRVIKMQLSNVNGSKIDLWNKSVKEIEKKLNSNERYLISSDILSFIGKTYYEGINNPFGKIILPKNQMTAFKMFYQARENLKEDDCCKVEVYNMLKDFYRDRTLPIYNVSKALEIDREMEQKKIRRSNSKKNKNKDYVQRGRVFVCSDLHGSLGAYKAIVSNLKKNDKLFILGDVIDRGEDGIKILQDIIKKQDQITLLLGNHEFMMLQSLYIGQRLEYSNWCKNNGGDKTVNQFHELSKQERETILEFLKELKVYQNIIVSDKNFLLVHSNTPLTTKSFAETFKEMLNSGRLEQIKEAVWHRGYDYGLRIPKDPETKTIMVRGHEPSLLDSISTSKNEDGDRVIKIDCGAGSKKNVGLLCLNDWQEYYYSVKEEDTREEKQQKTEKEVLK